MQGCRGLSFYFPTLEIDQVRERLFFFFFLDHMQWYLVYTLFQGSLQIVLGGPMTRIESRAAMHKASNLLTLL